LKITQQGKQCMKTVKTYIRLWMCEYWWRWLKMI
jgi:hypothetical protein